MKNYFADAERARVVLTKKQQKAITDMYLSLAKDIQKEIEDLSLKTNVSSTLRVQYLEGLAREINEELKHIGYNQETFIKTTMFEVSKSVVESNNLLLTDLGVHLKGAYSYIPRDVVQEIATGKLYEGRWDLSSTIWKHSKKAQSDINMIVSKGVAANKSSFDIAKDLEKYVNPKAHKDWEWSKVYPGVNKKVDYNAQRLARTMVSHAYEDSFVKTTKDNPFIEAYQWETSNSDRVCPICKEREDNFHGVIINGEEYPGAFWKDDLPLDHPNGMCTFTPIITVDYNSMADRLADWVNGEEDDELDDFAESLGYSIKDVKDSIEI